MLPNYSSARLLIEPDDSRFDEDSYRVHKGAIGFIIDVYPGTPNWYTIDFTDPDTTDGISCTLLDLTEDQIEPVEIKRIEMEIAKQTFTAFVHQEEEYYLARCFETGTASQGASIEEAIANLREATALHLEEFPQA